MLTISRKCLDGLDFKAANGTDLPYEGWVDDFDHTVKVPFLIAKDSLDMPIVGYNVIEEITKFFDRGSSARVNGLLVDMLTSSLTGVE